MASLVDNKEGEKRFIVSAKQTAFLSTPHVTCDLIFFSHFFIQIPMLIAMTTTDSDLRIPLDKRT